MPSIRCLVTTAAIAAGLVAVPSARADVVSGSVLYQLLPQDGYFGSVATTNHYSIAAGAVAGGSPNNHIGDASEYALMWSAPNGAQTALNPAGFYTSFATGASPTQQSGFGRATRTSQPHALLWSGSAASYVDLHPTGFLYSYADAVAAGQQVGRGLNLQSGYTDALLWTGSGASAVDLHPTAPGFGVGDTYALGTDGAHQVGYGYRVNSGGSFAILWSGSAASAVSLEPINMTGIVVSGATAVSGNEQVGYVQRDYEQTRAVIWHGSGASALELTPTNLPWTATGSEATGTNGVNQVGVAYGYGGNHVEHAVMWSGTPDSAVDLHTLLPTGGAWYDSYASTIDPAGNIYGTADGTYNGVTGTYVVEWSAAAVPEQAMSAMLLLAGGSLLARRRRT